MRIWSLHPEHLDRMGLLACWRETLLAQAVLAGRTSGYTNHPQLERFRAQPDPLATVGFYLAEVAAEAGRRGYRFDAERILQPPATDASMPRDRAARRLERTVPVTQGQIEYEWLHLGRKLHARSAEDSARWESSSPRTHALFSVVPGDIESWERPDSPGVRHDRLEAGGARHRSGHAGPEEAGKRPKRIEEAQ